MLQMDSEEEMIVAILHDVVEDSEKWSFDKLKEEGFSKKIINSLRSVTKENKNEDYEKFELEYFLPMWQKLINSGGLRMWGLAKVVSSSDDAFKNLTHFVFQNRTGMELVFEEETFLDSKLLQLGLDSRKMYDAAELEIIHIEN